MGFHENEILLLSDNWYNLGQQEESTSVHSDLKFQGLYQKIYFQMFTRKITCILGTLREYNTKQNKQVQMSSMSRKKSLPQLDLKSKCGNLVA